MIGFIADYEFDWGFQARIVGLSKTSPSFLYPPPTTFLGALAEAVAKENEIGESKARELMAKLSENLCAIGWKALNCVPLKYSDINRILAVKITAGTLYPTPEDLGRSFDSPARGKTILSSLNEKAPTIRWFLVFKEPRITLNGRKIEICEDLFWKIHRISSKESRVSAVNVEKVDVQAKKGVVQTTYSFPVDFEIRELGWINPKWDFEVYMNPFAQHKDPISSYLSGKNAIPFRVPIVVNPKTLPEYRLEVENYVAYTSGEETVIGCQK
ncbi:MAG: type I-A CRISPR-associated protein Cas5a [Archaeoglobales archaeon]|nr:type I-A CRISPR-associated protein Cas5a [Archaeoglobales archaeon]